MRNTFDLLSKIIIVLITSSLKARGVRPIIFALSSILELLVEHVVICLFEWILDVVYLKVFILLVHNGSGGLILVLD